MMSGEKVKKANGHWARRAKLRNEGYAPKPEMLQIIFGFAREFAN
jgi:hypothetical protein